MRLIEIPAGMSCERIGGGFEAFITRMVVPATKNPKFAPRFAPITIEFYLCHSGCSSAPTTEAEALEPHFVEVYVDELSSDEPEAAVASMVALGLNGGDNGDSGALTWYFDDMAGATEWIEQAVQTAVSIVISRDEVVE